MHAYEDVITRRIFQLIEEDNEAVVPDFIDTQLREMQLPDWYKSEILNSIQKQLKEVYSTGSKGLKHEKYKLVISAIENRFGTTLLKF